MSQPAVILSLCDYTGIWAKPYVEAGYEVRLIDVKHGRNVLDYEPPRYRRVHGVLAAPPCTVFANSGARWHRSEEDLRAGLAVVDACCRIIAATQPEFWAIENPVGTLTRWLGAPRLIFQPCDYGDPEHKQTALWGKFVLPTQTPVPPVRGNPRHLRYGGSSERTKEARSATFAGFARAFYKANP